MPVTYHAADAPVLVTYVFAGDWTAAEFLDRRRELLRAAHLTAKTAVLFDLRSSAAAPALGDLDAAIHAAADADAIWPMCRAFLIRTQEQYACARQLQAVLGPHSVINEIFQDQAAALEWLSAMTGRQSVKA